MRAPDADGVQHLSHQPESRNTQSLSPDLSKYDFHTPLRKRSRVDHLPDIVIPSSTEIYDSETPSPLSPITPPDRLSPIEELDDNESLRSKRGPRLDRFETAACKEFEKPRSRPRSGDFDLDDIPDNKKVSLENRSELLFSRQHLEIIFADKSLALRFGSFLRTYRPDSVPVLVYYLDTIKALKSLNYAEAVVRGLEQIPGLDFTTQTQGVTMKWVLEDKANRALDILAKNDLPAFIAYVYVRIVDEALVERVTGKADINTSEVADGLAEVFCLSDPSRPDNPLIFASEEFHRMTQYPSSKALGRNCRFLGGPKTDPNAICRFKASLQAEREHCEVMLNYRRDGTPFINLIMCVPLRDQNGKVRYYLGAQLDITELVENCTGLESLRRLQDQSLPNTGQLGSSDLHAQADQLDEFQQLSETFTPQELERLVVSQQQELMDSQEIKSPTQSIELQTHGIRPKNSSAKLDSSVQLQGFGSAPPLGFYQNYLLVRPSPSLRILFASPDLRVRGILQSPLMDQIGGSKRVQDDLYQALEAGQKVTAKVQWLSRTALDGRARWIHCTPLISANGAIGVWMVILVDDEEVVQAPKLQSVTSKIKPNKVPQPTPWEAVQDSSRLRSENEESPSTSNSSHTLVSEPARLTYEKIPPTVKEMPDSVLLPFASSRLRGSDASVQTAEPKHENRHLISLGDENDDLRRSTDEYTKARNIDVEEDPKPRQTAGPGFGQPPNSPAFPVRPGPRIGGKVYSYDSNSSRRLFTDDDRDTIASRGSDNRSTSQDSNVTAIRSQISPTNLRWRKVDEQEGVLERRGWAPIKLPGRSSLDAERPPVWKTKKSLSPYGVLFDD